MAGIWGVVAAILVVNLVRGGHGGVVSLLGLGRVWTWGLTLALLAAMVAILGWCLKNRWDGVFIGPRNKIGLSRFQLVVWTILIVGSLLTAGLANVSLGDATPLEIVIPPQIWALLGLGSFTFVAAPAILTRKERLGAANPRLDQVKLNLARTDNLKSDVFAIGPVVRKATSDDARWLDMFRGDEDADTIDFSKVQQFTVTGLLLVIYAAALARLFAGPGPLKSFPDIDGGFIALLGISHAAYLANKAAPKS